MAVSSAEENDHVSEIITSLPNWSLLDDNKLLYAMFDHKPIGINKNFHMIEILSIFNDLRKLEGLTPINSSILWSRIKEMYNTKELDEYEPLPIGFPAEEIDFENVLQQCEWYKTGLTDIEEDKPLIKKLTRSESEESKLSSIADLDENTPLKQTKLKRKKFNKVEENVSSDDESSTKSLRKRVGRLSNIRKSESPVAIKKKK